MMTEDEIIEADWKKNNYKFAKEQCLAAYDKAIDPSGIWKKYRCGNSLMFVRGVGEGRCVFHFVNADRIKDFVHNVIACCLQAREDGFNEIYTTFTNPKILEVLKQVPFSTEVKERVVDGEVQYMMIGRLQ